MDDGLNRGGMLPMGHDYDGGKEGDSPASLDPQQPLTHRSRNFANLTPAAIKTASGRGTSAHLRDATALPPGSRDTAPTPVPADTLPGSAGSIADLHPFADQLIAIAQQLRTGDFAAGGSAPGPRLVTAHPSPPAKSLGAGTGDPDIARLDPERRREAFAEMARVSYAKRRKRTTIFGDPELFGEPAWDILLDLYIAQAEEKSVSVSSACIGSASPPTTGLRWLGVLADQGLLERKHDPLDQRRVLVRLSDKALDAMDEYFAHSAGLQSDRRAARR